LCETEKIYLCIILSSGGRRFRSVREDVGMGAVRVIDKRSEKL